MGSEIISDCRYHVVFCTKYRKEVLKSDIKEVLCKRIPEILENKGVELLQIEIESSYVYLRVRCTPQIGIHRVVKNLKDQTSSELRNSYPALNSMLPSLWTLNYYCTTSDKLSRKRVSNYVDSQKRRGDV